MKLVTNKLNQEGYMRSM